MATDVEKNCDQIVLEDGVQRLGAGISLTLSNQTQGFTADLIGKARKRMTEEGYGGLLWISTIFDKRQKCYTMVRFGFSRGVGFAVPYGKVRNGKLAALSKTLCDLGNQTLKKPDQGLKLWPPTVEKEFVITTFSFPRNCESCQIFRFAPLRQLSRLHGR